MPNRMKQNPQVPRFFNRTVEIKLLNNFKSKNLLPRKVATFVLQSTDTRSTKDDKKFLSLCITLGPNFPRCLYYEIEYWKQEVHSSILSSPWKQQFMFFHCPYVPHLLSKFLLLFHLSFLCCLCSKPKWWNHCLLYTFQVQFWQSESDSSSNNGKIS